MMESVMQRVTAAIMEEKGRIFIARRGPGKHLAGKWEFPGGKIEPGETPEQSLARELVEELGINVRVGERLCSVRYLGGSVNLELLAFRVTERSGEPVLHEHEESRWVSPSELLSYDLAESDRKIVERLYG
jgi:8-oxo-dGTP diphosphatase